VQVTDRLPAVKLTTPWFTARLRGEERLFLRPVPVESEPDPD